MQLIGEHQLEDRQLIAAIVLAKMNQESSRSTSRSPQRPATTAQPAHVRHQTQTIVNSIDDTEGLGFRSICSFININTTIRQTSDEYLNKYNTSAGRAETANNHKPEKRSKDQKTNNAQ